MKSYFSLRHCFFLLLLIQSNAFSSHHIQNTLITNNTNVRLKAAPAIPTPSHISSFKKSDLNATLLKTAVVDTPIEIQAKKTLQLQL